MLVQDGREIKTQNKLVVICHQIWHQTLRNEHISGKWNNSSCCDIFEKDNTLEVIQKMPRWSRNLENVRLGEKVRVRRLRRWAQKKKYFCLQSDI